MHKIYYIFPVCYLTMAFATLAPAETRIGDFYSSGYAEGFFYPSHNEYDPNPMINPLVDRPVARYGVEFEATLSHARFLPKLFAFVHSMSLFGDTRPQNDYNYKANPIVMILKYGAGYRLTDHAQVRISTARHIDMGKYKGEKLMWSAVSFRWQW